MLGHVLRISSCYRHPTDIYIYVCMYVCLYTSMVELVDLPSCTSYLYYAPQFTRSIFLALSILSVSLLTPMQMHHHGCIAAFNHFGITDPHVKCIIGFGVTFLGDHFDVTIGHVTILLFCAVCRVCRFECAFTIGLFSVGVLDY